MASWLHDSALEDVNLEEDASHEQRPLLHITAPPAAAAVPSVAVRSPHLKHVAVAATPASARRSLFSFWSRPAGHTPQHSRRPSHATGHSSVPPSPSVAAAAAAAAATAAAAAPPRRRWFRYPIRVPVLALLLVTLLARTSEGWTSIAGFLCGFLLFEGFSAPDTGQPNRLDGMMKKCMGALAQWRRRRRRKAAAAKRRASRASGSGGAEHARSESWKGRICRSLQCIRAPFRWCCRRAAAKPRHSHAAAHNNMGTDSDVGTSAPLLPEDAAAAAATAAAEAAAAQAENEDVLLDVAVSITEDADDAGNGAVAAAESDAAAAAASPNGVGVGDDAGAASPVQPSSVSVPSTPLHALQSLTDSPLHLPSLPSLPTVTSLASSDLADDGEATSGVVGGKATFAHVSVSLKFTWRAYHIHLHHWLYLLLLFLFLVLEQTYWSDHAASLPVYAFFSAFCLGGSIQGLKYADWHHVVWRKAQEQASATQRVLERRLSQGGSSSSGGSASAGALSPRGEAMERMEYGEGSSLLADTRAEEAGGMASGEDEAEHLPSLLPLSRQPSLSQLHNHA